MVFSGNTSDSQSTSRKEIEELIKENKNNKKLNEIIKSKGVKLEELLNTETEIEYDTLDIKTSYYTRNY